MTAAAVWRRAGEFLGVDEAQVRDRQTAWNLIELATQLGLMTTAHTRLLDGARTLAEANFERAVLQRSNIGIANVFATLAASRRIQSELTLAWPGSRRPAVRPAGNHILRSEPQLIIYLRTLLCARNRTGTR